MSNVSLVDVLTGHEQVIVNNNQLLRIAYERIDVLEKTTVIFGAIIGLIGLLLILFYFKNKQLTKKQNELENNLITLNSRISKVNGDTDEP